MKKFILIDQSIKDGAGHHLEYALRVLKAAKQEGFLTVLAVNKSCDIIESSFIDVVERSFTYGYWENYSCQKQDLKKDRKELLKTFIEKKDDFIYEIIFSQLGFAYHLLSSGKSVSRMAGEHDFTTEDQKISSYSLTVSSVLYRIWHYCKKAKLFFERIIKIAGKPVQYVFRLMKFFLAILLFPIIIVYLVFKWDIILSRFDQFSLLFARECNRLLDKISVENGDLIFVPTLGDLELTGIGICSKEKRLSGIEWHLLFRRNLFTGREGDYLRQMDSVQKTKVILLEFKKNFTFGNVAFYTDTDSLTEQWNMLKIYEFKTLPIPHDEVLKKVPHRTGSPYIITYLGDARDEKGFQYLSQLVTDLRSCGFNLEKVKFRFQSNFNIPFGEPGSKIAKSELELMSADGVDLIEGPFDSIRYADLINNADLLLFPYNEVNYYARSSGVFAEALKAGVPVVYPGKSWMGRALLEENISYYTSMLDKWQPTSWTILVKSDLSSTCFSISQNQKKSVVLFRYDLAIVRPGSFVRVSLYEKIQTESNTNQEFKNVLDRHSSSVIDLRVNCGVGFCPVNKSGNYVLTLEHIDAETDSLNIENFDSFFSEFSYTVVEPSQSPDRQSVGYGFENVNELCTSVNEVLSHYDSYERRSSIFSVKWGQFHSSKTLLSILTSSNSSEIPVKYGNKVITHGV